MKKVKFLLATLIVALFAACGTTSTVPVTGRKHTLLVSDEQVLSLSNQEYTKYMKSAKVSANAANTAMVKRVGQRLATAVETYLTSNGMANEVKNFHWEFNLIQDQNVNAFCMPGGKIVVYEGLLPVTRDEASLAIVLGHEIAHAVAKHSAEQMSKQIRQQYGTQIGSQILGAVAGNTVGSLAGTIAQQGFSFANLKYSRDNETEADRMGLIFAAMAGYNPEVAIPFWQRMSASNGNSNSSDWLSDHPSDAKRIAALQKEMPEALAYYKGASTSAGTTKSTRTTKSSTSRKSSSKSVSASQLYKNTKK